MVASLRYVFVDEGDVSNTGIKPYGVVLDPGLFENGLGHLGVSDLFQPGPFAFDVAE